MFIGCQNVFKFWNTKLSKNNWASFPRCKKLGVEKIQVLHFPRRWSKQTIEIAMKLKLNLKTLALHSWLLLRVLPATWSLQTIWCSCSNGYRIGYHRRICFRAQPTQTMWCLSSMRGKALASEFELGRPISKKNLRCKLYELLRTLKLFGQNFPKVWNFREAV